MPDISELEAGSKIGNGQNPEKKSYRQLGIYFFLIFCTSVFIFINSSPFDTNWSHILRQPKPIFQHIMPTLFPRQNVIEKGFVVYSKNCKIPDLDPWHPSIRHLIAYTEPVNCSDYEALTWSKGNTLYLDHRIAEKKSYTSYSCCYKSLFRDENGKSDNEHRFSKECTAFKNETPIVDEFILVECRLNNGTVFYKNYHAFIQEKKEVEERCANSTAKYNVLILGVDAVSRLNMHRQLNKTASFLLHHMNTIEMFGFNKVGDNTFPNLIPLLLGYDERELQQVCWKSNKGPLDKCDFLWHHFRRKGYRTLYAEDTPYMASFNYQKEGFFIQPTDYYFRNYIYAFEDELGRKKTGNCHLCVGSISETEAVLQWVQQFATVFQNRPYFAFAWINSLTHDYLNLGSAGDHLYENFFKELFISGALNNTIVILMGDHGMRWGQIRTTYVGRLEERLPMLMIALPQKFKDEYPAFAKNLEFNAHKLVTPFDLHATLENVLHLDEDWTSVSVNNVEPKLKDVFVKRSLSLFAPVPDDRSCQNASIDEHWCTCRMSVPVDKNSTDIKLVALFIVRQINSLLKFRSEVCAVLNLDSIIDSRAYNPLSESDNKTSIENIYTVIIQTEPGEAMFEGTARYVPEKSDYDLLGTISRLNMYGNQSSCVHDAILQKYCYCL